MTGWIEELKLQIEQGKEEMRNEREDTRAYRGEHKCIPYYEDGLRKYRYKPEFQKAQRKAYYEKNKAKINEQNRIKYRKRTKIENLKDNVIEFSY